MKFIIYFINGKIKIYDDNRKIYIKFEGEEEFPFFSDFWDWFKKKIEYDNEKISFIIVCDKKITIPNDFNIAKKSAFEKIPTLLSYKNCEVLSFPKIVEKIEVKKVEKNSIFEHFLKKAIKKRVKNER